MSSNDLYGTSVASRRFLFFVALASFSILWLGSLTPFEFTEISLEELKSVARKISGNGMVSRSHVDWGVNVTIMIPTAFAVCGLLCVSVTAVPRAVWALLALLLCLLMSISVEVAQIFTPKRVPSLGDVAAQFLGAWLGVGLWLAYGRQMLELLQPYSALTVATPPVVRASKLWIACFVAYSLLPYDMSLRPSEFFEKWNSGKISIIPFSSSHPSLAEAIYAYATDIAVWIPLGLVALYRYGNNRERGMLFCLGCVSAVELLQLTVISRFTDFGDVILGFSGACLGLWIGSKTDLALGTPHSSPKLPRNSMLYWGAVCLYGLCLIVAYTFPWNFSADPLVVKDAVRLFVSQPFGARYSGNVLAGLFDVVRTTVLFGVLGGALSVAISQSRMSLIERLHVLVTAIFVLVISSSIQVLRVFLPDNGLDLSDVIIALVAGISGLLVGRIFLSAPATPRERIKTRPDYEGGYESPLELSSGESDVMLFQRTSSRRGLTRTALSPFISTTLLLTLFLAGGLTILVSLPMTPYNIKELLSGGSLFLTLPLASLASILAMMFPRIIVAHFLINGHVKVRKVLVAVIGSIFIAWAVAYKIVPRESLYDVMGSPIWTGTPEFFELGWRFFGFFLPVTFVAYWAATRFLLACEPSRVYGLNTRLTVMYCCFVLPLSYFITVLQASTDNIVELLPNNGYSVRTLLWGCYPVLLVFSAHFLASRNFRRLVDASMSVMVVIASAVVGYQIANYGFDFIVIKYGRAFTPLQFLLSPRRGEWIDTDVLPWVFMGVQTAVLVLYSVSLRVAGLWVPRRAASPFKKVGKAENAYSTRSAR
ncbi:conserved hypothetical protein [gamma proteobacterium NOR5-3]|nr:conserved hypothetical protein [gamma proteobacterium NOR5-3]